MNLLFVGNTDPANVSNRTARAINRCNSEMRARVVTVQRHPFGYAEDVVLHRGGQAAAQLLRSLLANAHWIIHTGDSNYEKMFKLLRHYNVTEGDVRYRWATRHGGSTYRARPDYYNALDAKIGFELRLFAYDLYRFAKSDPRARVYAHAQDSVLGELPPIIGSPIVCHAPSNPTMKGSDEIVKALESADVPFRVWSGRPFDEIVENRAKCHIYIDQLNADIGGFGAATAEAMAAGLVVLSDIRHVDDAADAWIPRPPVIAIRSGADAARVVMELVRDRRKLEVRRRASLRWAQACLTDAFTYSYWSSNLT